MGASTPMPGKSTGKVNYAQNGWRYDNKVTAMMVDDMLFDPILAAKVILGIKVPPHMELRIMQMWGTYMTIDDSGFSTGKSFTFAIVSALRSILMAGRVGGIVSGSFRQGKLIFRNYENWHNTSKIFRSCIKYSQGKPRIIHGSDAWEAHFRGMSTVRVLPPAFTTDSTRLRSERWHDGYFDEWTIFGNFEAMTKTLFGRVSNISEWQDCPVRGKHIHLGSTPGFEYDAAFKIVKRMQRSINAGNENYARFSANYRHVPKKDEWDFLVDRKTIFTMQTMNPLGIVRSEIDGVWQKDSMSFYSAAAIFQQRRKLKLLTKRWKDSDVYIAAFDTARGSQRSRKGGDDFSLCVWRIPYKGKPAPCYMVRRNNITAEAMSGIIHDAHRKFHFTYLLYDPGGGGLFVRDELRNQEQIIRGKAKDCTPIIELDDATGVLGDAILIPVQRGQFHISFLWKKMASDSVLLNRIHGSMKKAIESDMLMFPSPYEGWQSHDNFAPDADTMRTILNRAGKSMSEEDRLHAELDLAVTQLISVDVKRGPDKQPITDSHGMFKFKSKYKKDSAYSMIYGYVGVLIYFHMMRSGMVEDDDDDDGSSVCAAGAL